MRTTRDRILGGVIVLLSLALITAGCGDDEKPIINLHVWEGTDFHWLNNAITGFIIETGYGYPVETVVETTPVLQQALPRGEVDLLDFRGDPNTNGEARKRTVPVPSP